MTAKTAADEAETTPTSDQVDEWRMSEPNRAKCLRLGWDPDSVERAARDLARSFSTLAENEQLLARLLSEPTKPKVGRGHVPRTWDHKVKRT